MGCGDFDCWDGGWGVGPASLTFKPLIVPQASQADVTSVELSHKRFNVALDVTVETLYEKYNTKMGEC